METRTDFQDLAEGGLDPSAFFDVIYNRNGDLREIARSGMLGNLHNRFIVWRIFLGIFDENKSADEWVQDLRKYRKSYQDLKQSLDSVECKNLDPSIFNPLSQASENPWNNFYQDNELKQTIQNDVDRTLQERSLFQKQETKQALLDILFIWSKQNPEISYRQGMNELLAILFIVGHSEKAEPELSTSLPIKALMQELNNPKFLEHDLYELFSRLMNLGVKQMFLPVLTKKPKLVGNLLTFDKKIIENDLINSDKTHDSSSSFILKKCHRVHHRLLQALDKQLYNFIESQKIEPQIYLQRWLRCMLTREFNLANTLILWDCIFSNVFIEHDNKIESFTGKLDFNRELVALEFLCVAMIVFVRSFLLNCDSTGILRRLLKFPPVEDVRIIISMAQSFQERILTGKGVSVPRAHIEEPGLLKAETKNQVFLISSPRNKKKVSEQILGVVDMLQEQIDGYRVFRKCLDRMAEVIEKIVELREDIYKMPRKIR